MPYLFALEAERNLHLRDDEVTFLWSFLNLLLSKGRENRVSGAGKGGQVSPFFFLWFVCFVEGVHSPYCLWFNHEFTYLYGKGMNFLVWKGEWNFFPW